MRKMLKRSSLILVSLIVLAFVLSVIPASVINASYNPIEAYDDHEIDKKNPETGYHVVILDGADLLSSSEIKKLAEEMAPITEFGNITLVTTDENDFYDTEEYAAEMLEVLFNEGNSTVVLIDMQERYIWVQSSGSMERVIKPYYNDITDNCYKYATKEDYYGAASSAMDQIYRLMNGQLIARPMKIICSVFMALLLSLLFNFFYVNHVSKLQNTTSTEMLTGAAKSLRFAQPKVYKTGETRTYSPQSSGSSGGGGGSRGGGGGGHHSSGGGHRF